MRNVLEMMFAAVAALILVGTAPAQAQKPELSEIDAVPSILAEQCVGIGHGLNAPIERLDVRVE